MSLEAFETATGLRLATQEGAMIEELPPITTFLNRVLALPIALQNQIFELFEELLNTRIEAAMASGTYDAGLETLLAESLAVADRRVLHTHARTGATTSLLTIERQDRNEPRSLDEALEVARAPGVRLLVNGASGRAAVALPAGSMTLEDGMVDERVRMVRPMSRDTVSKKRLEGSNGKRPAWKISQPPGSPSSTKSRPRARAKCTS